MSQQRACTVALQRIETSDRSVPTSFFMFDHRPWKVPADIARPGRLTLTATYPKIDTSYQRQFSYTCRAADPSSGANFTYPKKELKMNIIRDITLFNTI